MAKVAALFAARHGDIALTTEAIPQPDYLTKMTAAVVSGSRPDVGMVTAFRFSDFVAMDALVNLSPKIAGWSRRGEFADAAWAPATRDGKIYGVPSTSFVNWMYYRPDYFAEAGIAAPPDTMVDFLAAAIKLTDAGKNRYGFGMRGGAGGGQFLTEMIQAWGSPIVLDGKPAIDRPRAIEAVRFYSELFTKYHVTPPSTPNDSYRQMMDGFKTGQTAMLWHHTGSLNEIVPALGRNRVATAIRPGGPAARIAQVEYLYNAVTDTRNLDAAWEWVSWWAEPEAAIAFLDETGYFPADREAARSKRIVDDPLFAPAIKTLTFGTQLPAFAGYDNWSAQIAFPAFQQVLTGQTKVEEAVDIMMRGLERTLR